ncbi:MAG TPA: membrane protein insertase YidC [Steroidobacteraceae bacterium]|nr:membrane protein insertase YidC [Steroidobacteraceae bacterium]
MPNTRIMLWVALAAMLYFNYGAWMRDYGAKPEPAAAGRAAPLAAPAEPNLALQVPLAAAPPLPEAAPASAASAAGGAAIPPAALTAPPQATAAQMLRVKTDVFDIRINLKGGELDRADLLKYPLHKEQPNVPVRLLNDDGEESLYLLQSGLTGVGAEAAPNHLAMWSAAKNSYQMASGADELRVPLTWTDGHGLDVTKTFIFKRGWYAIGLVYDVDNSGTAPRELAMYAQILRYWQLVKRSYFNVSTYSFKGPAVYDGTKYRDLQLQDKADRRFSETISNGWLAALEHHFVSAIVPAAGEPFKYRLQMRNHEFLLSATGPLTQVAAGGKVQFHEKLFVGPKLQSQLAATGPQLQRSVDYGKLTIIAQPLFATLKWVHGITGNWGWSIIIVTALIKLLFYPLSQASGRSMAKMRSVGPRMKQIQETFKDDREKLGRAMMELYKKEKINPLAGCLPMIVQIPFFISFYWVLLESVEMRQAPFMFWVNDLSVRDPYFVLPLLMGAAMFAQFKLNPAPPDPTQAKIMQFMPLVMTATMAWFPAGLVLYWLTNTVLSIAQQWRINQLVQTAANKPRS